MTDKVAVPYEAGVEIYEEEQEVTGGTTAWYRDMFATWGTEVAFPDPEDRPEADSYEVNFLRSLIAEDLVRIVVPRKVYDEINKLYNRKGAE
jgi:hypothetical protein